MSSSSHRTKVVLKCSRYIWPDLLEEILPALVRKTCWWNGCGQALVPQLFLQHPQDIELLLLAVQRRLVPNNSWLSRTERKMVNLADIRDAFEVSDEEIVPLAPNNTRSWYQLGCRQHSFQHILAAAPWCKHLSDGSGASGDQSIHRLGNVCGRQS